MYLTGLSFAYNQRTALNQTSICKNILTLEWLNYWLVDSRMIMQVSVHGGRNEIMDMPQTTILCTFWTTFIVLWFEFHLNMTRMFIQGLSTKQKTTHYLNQWRSNSLTPYGVTRLQCIKAAQWIHLAMLLTPWYRDKFAAIWQTTFSNAFSSIKIYEFRFRFHHNLFLRFKWTIFQHWFT